MRTFIEALLLTATWAILLVFFWFLLDFDLLH
jgi:hypothetical protein